MNSKDEYFKKYPELKSKNAEKYVSKDNITWLKEPEDIPAWLDQLFNSKGHAERMKALRRINSESMSTRVENN